MCIRDSCIPIPSAHQPWQCLWTDHPLLPVLPMLLHQPCQPLRITAEEQSHQQVPLYVWILPVPVRELILIPILIAAVWHIPGCIPIPSAHQPWQCLWTDHPLLPVLPMLLHQPCQPLRITAEEQSHQQVPLYVWILPVPVRELILIPILIAAVWHIPGCIPIPSAHQPWQCLWTDHPLLPVLPMLLHQPCQPLRITAEEQSHQQVPL